MAQEAAADHDGGEIRLQHQRLAERFHHDHGFDRAGAKAAIGLRKGQTQQALLGELAPDGLAPAALLLLVLLARIEIVGVGQQTVDAFLEKALLLGQIKIHVFLLSQIMPEAWKSNEPVGWVERSETHRTVRSCVVMGIASLHPSYELSIVIPAEAGS